jgi:hypothetical protein
VAGFGRSSGGKDNDRFATIVKLIDDDRVYLPFTVVHAERVD